MKPTAWLKELPPEDGNGMMMTTFEEVAKEWEEPVIPLYPKDAWVDLTKEECFELCVKHKDNSFSLLVAVQEKLMEKNNG